MVSPILSHGIFSPDDLLVVQAAYDRIVAEPWFPKGSVYRANFATYVIDKYRQGLVDPERLANACRAAAWKRYRPLKSEIEGYRFLLVEDDYLIAIEAKGRLEDLGAEVVGPVPTVSEALELIEHGPEIDGALLDVNLNGEMSYPVAGFLKMKQIPFAFVSGYDNRVLPAFYRASLVCSKPTDWATVAILVGRMRNGATDPVNQSSVLHLAS